MTGFITLSLYFHILTTIVYASGIAYHLSVANLVQFPSKRETSSYYVGAFFPDAFYNCFDESQTAENIHWPPFIKIAVDYYREHYLLKNKTNFELEAFIHGVFTHQVTDVAWHSLQSSEGIMKMLAQMDFDGSYKSAHNYMDTAGDFILMNFQLQNLSKDNISKLITFYSLEWIYPIDDILNILDIMGCDGISRAKLQICINRGQLGIKSELAALLASRKACANCDVALQKSPLFANTILSYYYGGLDQIVNTLESCVLQLQKWIADGTAQEPWLLCSPVFKKHNTNIETHQPVRDSNCTTKSVKLLEQGGVYYLSPMLAGSQFGYSIKSGMFLGEPALAVGAPYEDGEGSIYIIPLQKIFDSLDRSVQVIQSESISLYRNNEPINYPTVFGSKLVQWNLNGYTFLVASEPGLSKFSVFFGEHLVAVLHANSNNVIGSKGLKQLDFISDSCIDFDLDGSCDLVIGSPFADVSHSPQRGQVFIIKGKTFWDIVKYRVEYQFFSNNNPATIEINELVSHTYQIPKCLRLSEGYEQFGYRFALTKDYVFVTASSMGSVLVISRRFSEFIGLLTSEGFTPLDQISQVKRVKSENSQLFGTNFIITGIYKDEEWMLVSKSGDSLNSTCNQCGSAVLFKIAAESIQKVTTIVPSIPNKTLPYVDKKYIFGRFASNAIVLTDATVIISSPGYDDGKGAIYLLKLNDILKGSKFVEYHIPHLYHIGDKEIGYTDFGSSLETIQFNNKLYIIIGMPKYGFSHINDKSSKLSGFVKLVELN